MAQEQDPVLAFGSAQVFPDPARSLLGQLRVLSVEKVSPRASVTRDGGRAAVPLSWKPVRVRPATLEDLPVLVELAGELGRTAGRAATSQRYAEAIGDPDRHLVLAVTDGDTEPLGMALFTIGTANPLLEVPAVQITHTVVSHQHRKRGAGKALVAAAAAFADERGIDQLVISVHPASRESARFYARLGFAPLAVRRTASVALVRRRLGTSRLRV